MIYKAPTSIKNQGRGSTWRSLRRYVVSLVADYIKRR